MKSDEIPLSVSDEYERLLTVLSRTEKYFEVLHLDAQLLNSFKKLLRYLRSQSPEHVSKILGHAVVRSDKFREQADLDLSSDSIKEMTFQTIRELASNPITSRRLLEKIAAFRFGVTKGAISTLRTREALVAKIHTLIENEDAHDSITRAAAQAQQI